MGRQKYKVGTDDEYDDAAAFRSANPQVPADYRIDPEFNCLTNAENLADMSPSLVYTEGWCRFRGEKKWGSHAWCQTVEGVIVDPYFEWKFGEKTRLLEYKPAGDDESPFD